MWCLEFQWKVFIYYMLYIICMICLRVYVCMCTLIRSYQIFICVLLSLRITPFCWVFRKLLGTFYIFFYLYIFTSSSFCSFLLLFLQYAYNLYAFHAFHSHLRNSLRHTNDTFQRALIVMNVLAFWYFVSLPSFLYLLPLFLLSLPACCNFNLGLLCYAMRTQRPLEMTWFGEA